MFVKKRKKTAVVIGLGEFGLHLALNLSDMNCDCIVADRNSVRIESIKNYVMKAVIVDVTQKESLARIVPSEVDFVVVSLGNVEASVMAVLQLKDLGIKNIWIKAASEEHERILRMMGFENIIFPEKETGKRFATKILSNNLLDFLPLSDDYSVAELRPLENMEDRTLKEIDFRKVHNLSVIAIKKKNSGKMTIMPGPDKALNPSDTLVVLGKSESIDKYNMKKN